jgi:tyrosinase
MSKKQRKHYINAVYCMMDKPSVVPNVPAAQSLWADYAYLHIRYVKVTHFNGNFFAWHRHHLWLFEQALHDCGFPKELGVPYMHWPLYSERGFEDSTIFDESETSLGGNGYYTLAVDGNDNRVPHGTGGGCVMRGPFHDMVLNFQPFYDRYASVGHTLPDNWTVPVSRCLDRDFNPWILKNQLNQEIYDSVVALPDFTSFANYTDDPYASYSMHVGGHASVGMTMNDLFGGTIDPSFYLHHAGLDNLWNRWQEAGPGHRDQYNGTDQIFNIGGNEVNASSPIYFANMAPSISLGEAKDPMAGPYCYRYEQPICLDGYGGCDIPYHDLKQITVAPVGPWTGTPEDNGDVTEEN